MSSYNRVRAPVPKMDLMLSKISQVRLVGLLLLIQLFMLKEGRGMNIVLSFGTGKDSHLLVASYVGNNLVQRGHNVTALVGELGYRYRSSDPHFENLTFQVYTHSLPPEEVEELENMAVDAMLELSGLRFLEVVRMLNWHAVNECRAVMTDENLLRRLENTDVIVLDPAWPCGLLIKSHIESKTKRRIRLAALIPYVTSSFILRDAGSPDNPAYRPDGLTGLAYPMTFSQRVLNFIFSTIMIKPIELSFLTPYCDLASELGLPPIVREGCHMAGTYDLYLFNSHFTTEIPYPTMPNVINVGGLTVHPAQPLDKNYTDYLQQSGEHGVIVFTLGHVFATMTTKKPEIAQFFAEAFGRLPQRVLWQLPAELPFTLPPNVMTARWLPQNDLLGAPQTRVFVYHGGNNGYNEAVYHGVPIVVFPISADQWDIAARVEAKGIGKMISKYNVNADIIYDTLTEVLNNDSYANNVKHLSRVFRDRPMAPAETAAFWLEHIGRHGGEYLRSPIHSLNSIQYFMLDVIAFLTAIAVISVILISRFISCCCRCFCKRSKSGVNQSKKDD